MYRTRRSFDPHKSVRYGRPTFSTDKLVKYSPKYQYSRLHNFPFRGSHWRPRMNTIVVQIQGIAHPNDSHDPSSVAAFGVSFGQNCPRNAQGQLDPSFVQTQNRALLEAVRQVLAKLIDMRESEQLDVDRKECVIMVDSEYVSEGFDKRIWNWVENDYIKSDGELVKHSEAFRELHETLLIMEEKGMSVQFWKVNRKDVPQADELAKAALEA